MTRNQLFLFTINRNAKNMYCGEKLQYLMNSKNLRQIDISIDLNKSKSLVHKWINNLIKMKRENIILLAHYFKILPIELTDNDITYYNWYYTCEILYGYAKKYIDKREYNNAKRVLKRILSIYKDNKLDNKLLIYNVYSCLGITYTKGKPKKALKYFKKAKKVYMTFNHLTEGETAFKYADLLYNKSIAYIELKEFDKALICLKKAFKIRNHNDNISKKTEILNLLAVLYRYKNKYRQSLKIYAKLKKLWIMVFGEKHQNIGSVYLNVSTVFYFMGDYTKTIRYLKKSLSILKYWFNEENEAILTIFGNLGKTYIKTNNLKKAGNYLQKAFNISLIIHGADNSITKDYQTSFLKVKEELNRF